MEKEVRNVSLQSLEQKKKQIQLEGHNQNHSPVSKLVFFVLSFVESWLDER